MKTSNSFKSPGHRLIQFLAFLLIGSSPSLRAQVADLPFSSGSTGADGELYLVAPRARTNHSMVYDAARQNVVLFGGSSSAGISNDTYTWNGTRWTQERPASLPAARSQQSMAYDAVRQEVVMFGGYSGSITNDTWVWNGVTWASKTSLTVPTPRYDAAMAYDAERQEVVLFGGQSTTGVLNDTWVWNGTGWSQKAPTTSPSARSDHSMAYDAVRKEVVLFGGSTGGTGGTETWVWSGITWTNRTPATSPSSNQYSAMTWDAERGWVVMVGNTGSSTQYETWAWTGGTWVANALGPLPVGRYDTAIAYDAQRKEIVIFGGWNPQNGALRDTQIWSGGGWQQKANVDSYVLDMRSRASGVWNFTNITIGLGVNVDFQKNDSNTGVTWLASGPVNIDGTLNLSGNPGKFGSTQSYNRAAGGAGGYDGGMGGARFDQSGAYSGTPGQGPGGGAAGQTQGAAGSDATHKGTYGNSYLLPLIGGSGGGGGASGAAADGPNGGGGGGAILIASSRDLTLNGGILANGGNRGAIVFEGTNHYGGYGSGGSVVLVADRLNGSGTISAKGGDSSSTSNNAGRVRLEGYLRPLLGTAAGISPVAVEAPPLVQRFGGSNNSASLRITQVAGQAVPVTLTGSFDNPDVVFQQAGSVDIVVAGANLPDGTQVGCRITVGAQIITLPTTGTVALASGSATFSTTVPAGLGTIQAFTKNFTGQ